MNDQNHVQLMHTRMKELGLNLSDLVGKLGIEDRRKGFRTVKRVLRGRVPMGSQVRLFAEALDIPMENLEAAIDISLAEFRKRKRFFGRKPHKDEVSGEKHGRGRFYGRKRTEMSSEIHGETSMGADKKARWHKMKSHYGMKVRKRWSAMREQRYSHLTDHNTYVYIVPAFAGVSDSDCHKVNRDRGYRGMHKRWQE